MSDHTQGEMTIGVMGWGSGGDGAKYWNIYVDWQFVGTVSTEIMPLVEAQANAERIVRSWNRDDAFDDLLTACKRLHSALLRQLAGGNTKYHHSDDMAVTRGAAAIARATLQPETTER